jgi:antitoxin component YwqK of YwqJK toxin-antitoxin module
MFYNNLPSHTSYYLNGSRWEDAWYDSDDNEHKTDGPAIIRYYENGLIKTEIWLQKGVRTRTLGPAYTTYYQNGHKKLEMWYLNGRLTRLFNNSVYRFNEETGELANAHWSSSDILTVLNLIVFVIAIVCFSFSFIFMPLH